MSWLTAVLCSLLNWWAYGQEMSQIPFPVATGQILTPNDITTAEWRSFYPVYFGFRLIQREWRLFIHLYLSKLSRPIEYISDWSRPQILYQQNQITSYGWHHLLCGRCCKCTLNAEADTWKNEHNNWVRTNYFWICCSDFQLWPMTIKIQWVHPWIRWNTCAIFKEFLSGCSQDWKKKKKKSPQTAHQNRGKEHWHILNLTAQVQESH